LLWGVERLNNLIVACTPSRLCLVSCSFLTILHLIWTCESNNVQLQTNVDAFLFVFVWFLFSCILRLNLWNNKLSSNDRLSGRSVLSWGFKFWLHLLETSNKVLTWCVEHCDRPLSVSCYNIWRALFQQTRHVCRKWLESRYWLCIDLVMRNRLIWPGWMFNFLSICFLFCSYTVVKWYSRRFRKLPVLKADLAEQFLLCYHLYKTMVYFQSYSSLEWSMVWCNHGGVCLRFAVFAECGRSQTISSTELITLHRGVVTELCNLSGCKKAD